MKSKRLTYRLTREFLAQVIGDQLWDLGVGPYHQAVDAITARAVDLAFEDGVRPAKAACQAFEEYRQSSPIL